MSRHYHVITAEGAAIDHTTDAYASERRLSAILVHVSAAPTTSENLTVTLNSAEGAEHDAIIYTKDMSGVTDIAYTGINMPLVPGDKLAVTYTNSDDRTVGVRLLLE